ncbi:MAG: hypothetical protein ACE5H4_11940 [Candidatus Thorarchaeota archaeon]
MPEAEWRREQSPPRSGGTPIVIGGAIVTRILAETHDPPQKNMAMTTAK